ncbi:hypothetical protein EVAR_14881_1 [Eumeta japonica]|uniref:Uncharacterized protein n=1 Tax=Eumeta variegata TaxID=151549 RepID=A0A4C1V3T5_EUMVA|nr:hypothetical protein EVAR_14881_1 [Eumeta japonica]
MRNACVCVLKSVPALAAMVDESIADNHRCLGWDQLALCMCACAHYCVRACVRACVCAISKGKRACEPPDSRRILAIPEESPVSCRHLKRNSVSGGGRGMR